MSELRRITCHGGLIVLGTPNTELCPGHGFSFEEIDALLKSNFAEYRVFENAFIPHLPVLRALWERRVAEGRVGTIVSEHIDLQESIVWTQKTPRSRRAWRLALSALAIIGSTRSCCTTPTHGWLSP